MGNWGKFEYAIYARHDLDTGRSLALIMRSLDLPGLGHICEILRADVGASIFHVAFATQAAAFNYLEGPRWECDASVQQLEAQTGISSFQKPNARPLRVEDLTFNRDLRTTLSWLQDDLLWGFARVRLNFQALRSHVAQYGELYNALPDPKLRLPQHVRSELESACQMKIELAESQYNQMKNLQNRLQAQMDTTATWMAQRDMSIKLSIAQAVQRDSELMRGIAAVTMIFLPATFVATFFSMVFSHVGEERSVHLTVDVRIWLYPIVTVPPTIGVTTWYFHRGGA